MRDAVIVAAVRTPIGRVLGALRDVPVVELAALVIREVVRRANVDPAAVEDVIFGCGIQTGPSVNLARHALLKAGFPETVPGVTLDRRCASGLQAVLYAAQAIQTDNADIIVAGGVESMSRSPYFLEKFTEPYKRGPLTLQDSYGGHHNTPVELYGPLPMGLTAENVAEQWRISRREQDEFALQSHQRAVRAMREGRFREEIIPVPVPLPGKKGETALVTEDEHPRPDTSAEKLAQLPPVFKEGGTVTAGNSSGVNDGAAAVVVMSRERAKSLGISPLAMVRSSAVVGCDPRIMGIAPVSAIPKALKKAGRDLRDIDLIELNEAFASQSIACIRELKLDLEKLNVNGGAIALGHPIGCSGARLVATLLPEMKRRGARLGLVSLCVGGGQGIAALLERS